MGIEYTIKLANPGELSGDLMIVGGVLEHTLTESPKTQVVIHSFMGRKGMFSDGKEPPVSLENLRASITIPYRSKLIRQDYGTVILNF